MDKNKNTRIIGVDPGSRITGYGILEVNGSKIQNLEYGVIRLNTEKLLHERIVDLASKFEFLLQKNELTEMAVETVFAGKNIQSCLKLSQVRGVLIYLGAANGLQISEYSPTEVKKAAVGYGRATKEQIQYMIQKILKLKELPKPADAADALAIALCHANSLKWKKHLRGMP